MRPRPAPVTWYLAKFEISVEPDAFAHGGALAPRPGPTRSSDGT